MTPCFQVTRATISKDENEFCKLVNLCVKLEFVVWTLLIGLFDAYSIVDSQYRAEFTIFLICAIYCICLDFAAVSDDNLHVMLVYAVIFAFHSAD